jgi:endogenous inhibitor of DNA gyrase (YacG/DUF329 family)
MSTEQNEKLAEQIRIRIAAGQPKPVAIATGAFKCWLIDQTSFLPSHALIAQRVYHLTTDVVPKCKGCAGEVSWRKDLHSYSTFCSSKCAHNDPELKLAVEQTMLIKHGVKHFSQCTQTKENRKATTVARYGVTNNFWANKVPGDVSTQQFLKLNPNATNPKVITLINDGLTQREIGNSLGVSQPRISSLLHHLGVQTSTLSKTSSTQRQVCAFLRGLGVQVEENVKLIPPYDVDLWLPTLKIAVEVNGVFWHSELAGKDRHYHTNKTSLCENIGVQLIHIFDTEWIRKPEVVQSRLASLIKRSSIRIFARRCTVVSLDRHQTNQFFTRHHLQGDYPSQCNYGLMLDQSIVAAMSFCKSRYSSTTQYELLRFSNQLNTNVVGGASKLMNAFIVKNSPQSIISYSDRRWGSGGLYKNIGFTKQEDARPNYHYFDRGGDTTKLLSRITFQKHKLAAKLQHFNPSLTEWENMVANGYDRIWDCGNSVWVWTK